MREAASCALKYLAPFQNLRDTTALQRFAGRFLPGICHEAAAIHPAYGRGDARLQTLQVFRDCLWVHVLCAPINA
jgi:hypothetical protein